MPKIITLKENRDFRRLYHQGVSYISPLLVVYVKQTRRPFCRLGITAGKKVGGAVQRNRAKRLIKEAYRLTCGEFTKNADIVIVARAACAEKNTKMRDVQKYLRGTLKKAGIL